MQRTCLWLGASLAALSVMTGVFVFQGNQRHPDWIADAIEALSPSLLFATNDISNCPAEEACEPGSVQTADQPATKSETIQLFRVQADDAAKALTAFLVEKNLDLPIEVGSSNTQLILGIPADNYDEVMEQVREFLKTFDVQPLQFQVEMRLVEIESIDGKEGLRLFGDGRKFRPVPSDDCKALIADLQGQSRIDANSVPRPAAFDKQKQGWIDVCSTPTFVTGDNQVARILIAQSHTYVTDAGEATPITGIPFMTNNVNNKYIGIQDKDVGLQVQVTPHMSPDGKVCMRVISEYSTAAITGNEFATGLFATSFNVQTLETTVSVSEGETAIIGGLIRMANASMTGYCCESGKTELLLFLTPHVTGR